ncbi:MAG: glycosyltransferase [Planctomycetes bacterium]|nr:glycosyltransferase [Planctomycetota bacterium]
MKIGIDLRRLAFGASDDRTPWLHGALSALLARDPANEYVLFHTVYNYHLFPDARPNVTRYTLAVGQYYKELEDRVVFEGDYDVLIRCAPADGGDTYPLARQIVCLTGLAHEAHPERYAPAELRRLRSEHHPYQTRAGAVAVPTEAARQEVCADPWTTTNDVFVVPPATGAEPSWDRAADALAAALARVADRAATRVRVTDPPVVSIVTPSYNQGAFVRRTIDSVLGQDYPHIDYQVIDGGSTDGTLDVLKSYGPRLNWVSEKDRGQTHAINKGMARATGSIRAYLNSDDLLRPGAVRRVVEHFADRPNCDLVYGRDAFVDAGDRYLMMYPTAPYSFEALTGCCCISQPATFWRARLAARLGPFDENLKLVMDYDYWLRAACAGAAIEHIPDVLAHTRLHRDTKTNGAGDGAVDTFPERFYRELFDVCVRNVGYVSMTYVDAWVTTTLFHPRPWSRQFHGLLIRAAQKWHHNRVRCRLPRWRAAAALLKTEFPYFRRFVGRQLDALKPWKWFAARPAPKPRVGLGPDLWLEPELELPAASGPILLSGVPARDGELLVYRGGAEVARVPLEGDKPAEVRVDAPGTGPLRLAFSGTAPTADGRRVAFKLHGTTLFTEAEAA